MNYEEIATSVRGNGISEDCWNDEFEGCDCEDECSDKSGCSCLINGFNNYSVNSTVYSTSSQLLVECSSRCRCCLLPESCRNRVVQNGIQKDLQIFSTSEKGYGIRAGESIRTGEFICEYAGECIGEEEVERRWQEFKKEDNYTLTLKEHFNGKTVKTFLDPRLRGNIGRFLNHSCDPNCEVVVVRLGRMIPTAGIFSKRDISAGEELCYDYGLSALEGKDRKLCCCRAETCRKYLPMSASPIE